MGASWGVFLTPGTQSSSQQGQPERHPQTGHVCHSPRLTEAGLRATGHPEQGETSREARVSVAAEGRGAWCLGTALAGGDLGGPGAQGGDRRRARWLGRAGTGQPSPEPARLSQACAAGPKPATRALLRIRTNICVACCVCWGLVFFSRLKIGASRVPAGIPAPPAGWSWPGAPSLVPSCDLTAGDRSTTVSEKDYGVKAPITALQEACQRQASQARGRIGVGGSQEGPGHRPGPAFTRW